MSFSELQKFKRWLCWRVTQNGDSFEKIPVNPVTGRPAESNDPSTWVEYGVAKAAVDAGTYNSIGFALGDEVGLAIVDFDKVRATPQDPFPSWVRNELEELDSFTEVSVSGCGLHVLIWGSVPANLNRQKLHVEVWSKNKMFSLTGDVYEGRDTIQSRDLSGLHRRIQDGHIGPDYRPTLTVERFDSPRYRAIVNDEWASQGIDSRSSAIQSALCSLAVKHNFDRVLMRAEFEETPLCAAWEEKGKWTRLGDKELDAAIAFMSTRAPATTQVLDFGKPQVPGGDYDFIVNPADGSSDGWFPRGEVSLIGGSSGTGKTTLLIDILMKQSKREPVFGHTTNGLPYIVLLEDRSDRAMRRTLTRMRIDPTELPYRSLQLEGLTVAQAVAAALDNTDPTPAAMLLEGIDLASQDSNKMADVSRMLKDLQRTAAHYHVAIIGTTGAPKQRPKDKYVSHRDSIIGSSAWSRKVETVCTLQKSDGTEEDPVTILSTMLRNGPFESFRLRFQDGRLVEAPPEPEASETGKPELHDAENWVRERGESFEVLDLRQRFPMLSEKEAKKLLDSLLVQRVVRLSTQGRRRVYEPEEVEVVA